MSLNVNASSSAATRLQKRLHNQTNEGAQNLNNTRQSNPGHSVNQHVSVSCGSPLQSRGSVPSMQEGMSLRYENLFEDISVVEDGN